MDSLPILIREYDQDQTNMNFGPSYQQDSNTFRLHSRRLIFFAGIMLAVLGLFSARLVELTVSKGQRYRRRADENRLTVLPIPAARGVILDRNGTVLARNTSEGRSYPYGAVFAHVIGYTGQADLQGDIGKTGLEKQYDVSLRGQDGAQLIEVDANGKTVAAEGEKPAISGKNLQTTLDLPLQQTMDKALAGRRGAVVAVDPADGSILGLASSPSFDPDVFCGGREEEKEKREKGIRLLLNDTINLPLFNRAISGAYPPGSIFKLVTATAGLSSGKVTNETTVTDTGELKVGDFRYGNWYFDQYHRTEGVLGIVRAITRSNDIFFYKTGEWVGPELLSQWAKTFGLGKETGVDLPGEIAGLVPDPLWKERQIGERWFLGNTYHMAIGQGDVRVTPLQAAMMTSAAVTGKLCTPHIAAAGPVACNDTGVSDNFRSMILDGMVGACSTGGTAFPFFPWNKSGDPAMVACKTGTAQHGGEQKKPHAWIAVAGPIIKNEEQREKLDLGSRKRIVLVVLLEEAGEGSAEAGPVAKEILAEWFSNKE